MNQLYDVKTAAQILAISPWTIRAYVADGRLVPIRIGRRVLLERSELERFITEHRVSAAEKEAL